MVSKKKNKNGGESVRSEGFIGKSMLRVKNHGYFTLYPISFLTRAGLDCTNVVTSLMSKRKKRLGIILGKAELESQKRGGKNWLNAITLVESGHDGGETTKMAAVSLVCLL